MSASRLRLLAALFAALLAVVFIPASAQPACPSRCGTTPPLTAETSKFNLVPWAVSRMYGVSTAAPFTKHLRAQPARARAGVTEYFDFLKATENAIEASKRKSRGFDCNLRSHDWIPKTKDAIGRDRKLGVLNTTCTTAHVHSESEAARAMGMFARNARSFKMAGASLQSMFGWEELHALADWKYRSGDDQRCTLEKATALKLNGKWYVEAQVTNNPVQRLVPDIQRGFFEEWIAEDMCCPLSLWFKNFTANASAVSGYEETGALRAYTTITAIWNGATDISAFYNMPYASNRPLDRALRANALAVDQAADATRASNIAILALPMAMSFIPIAVIADVSAVAAFAYIVLTDFFAAVPFVIKGAELLKTGTEVKRGAETWVTGHGDLFVAESWAAACQPRSQYRTTGAILIAVGIAVIMSGCALEHFARKWMRGRILAGEDPRPFGDALFPMAQYPLIAPREFDGVYGADVAHISAPNYAADVAEPPRTVSPFSSVLMRLGRRRPVAGAPGSGPPPPNWNAATDGSAAAVLTSGFRGEAAGQPARRKEG